MATAVTVRADFSTDELRRLAAASKHANQSRRLLSLAAVVDGMSRVDAARIGGMDRQTLRDWVHRFNERGPEGLKDSWSKGHPPRLSAEQLGQLAEVVETGPERAVHGVVRWRRVDLQQIVAERFGVAYHERTIGKILKQLGFSHVSARPRHPARTRRPGRLLKNLRRDAERSPRGPAERQADRDLVPGRSPHRPEERPRAAVGAARGPPPPTPPPPPPQTPPPFRPRPPPQPRRSALRKRLPVRRHLPGARHRRGARHALRRQRGDATPPRRGLEPCPPRRPRRAPPRSGRLAYDPSLGRAEEHHPRLPALARPRAQSGREHLAVPAPELALEPCSKPTKRSSKRPATLGVAFSPSPPPSPQ